MLFEKRQTKLTMNLGNTKFDCLLVYFQNIANFKVIQRFFREKIKLFTYSAGSSNERFQADVKSSNNS